MNEPERVYCHNCGAKLDRSLLPKEEQIRREPPERARRRIMRMTNPNESQVKYVAKNLAKTVFFALVASGLILAARQPEGTPSGKPEMSTRLVSSDLSQAMTSSQPRTIAFTQNELNAFLASGKVAKAGPIPGVVYKRSFVQLEPGSARVSVERSYWGFSLFFSTIHAAEVKNAALQTPNLGGSIGRLPIHPLVMRFASPILFRDLVAGLKPEWDNVRKATFVQIDHEKVTLVSPGGARL